MKLEDIINQNLVIDLTTLKTDEELIEQIQTKLSNLGLYPSSIIDGLYGNRTETALIDFTDAVQLDNMVTGKFGGTFAEKILSINELPQTKVLNDIDYKRAANLLGVEVAVIRAIVEVESAGNGFLPDGRPKILFERHWFWKLTPLPVSRTRPDLSNSKPGGYLGGTREWDRLSDAIKFDRIAALKSASWGLGQVMGFNYEVVGFSDVEEFVRAMHENEGKQLQAMMNFIKNNPRTYRNRTMLTALRNHDWQTFAYVYNGSGGVGVYDIKLAAAYKRHAASVLAA